MSMKRFSTILALFIFASNSFAQTLTSAYDQEIQQGKDITQPGQINPALAGLQEDVFRLLTNTNLNDLSFMVEGKIPLKLGNYMVGYERFGNDYVSESTFNITYGRTSKKDKDKKWRFRYGGSLEISSRTSLTNDDSTGASGFSIVDLDGNRYYFQVPNELNSSINYLNLEFGGALQYDNLILSASLDNLLNPNVSMIEGDKRRLPLNANVMIGGFISPSKELTIYPSFISTLQADENYFMNGSIDVSYKYANLRVGYFANGANDGLTGTLAFHYKKTYFGLQYADNSGFTTNIPTFQVFVNAGLFKDRKLFKSDFAKQIGQFY